MTAQLSTSGPLLIAYDGSDLARHAVKQASELLPGRRAVVLHVYEPVTPPVPAPPGAAMVADASGIAYADRTTEAVRDRAEEIAQRGASLAEAFGLPARSETAGARGTSGIAEAIVEKATGTRASLIVMGSHGRSAIGAALLGSVSNAVLHRSSVPVLVVPASAGTPHGNSR